MKRKGLFIICCAGIHYIAMIAAIGVSFGYTMGRFDTGAPETYREHIATRIADMLVFPGYNIVERYGPAYLGRWGDLLMVLNSLLWAVCIYLLVAAFLRRRVQVKQHI